MEQPITDGWITTAQAQELTGYSRAHLGGLARRGVVKARKLGRDWLLSRDDLLTHKGEMDRLGESKHNPWRSNLAERGRGRSPDRARG